MFAAAMLSLALMAVMTVACLMLAELRPALDEAVVLAGLTLVAVGLWLGADKPVEGAILFSVGKSHGLTVADLCALAPLAALARLTSTTRLLSAARGR